MSDHPKYGKRIITESYDNDLLTNTKVEWRVPKFSSKEEILKDIIDALSPLTSGASKELTINIKVGNASWKITKEHQV